jgi:hypothetical protein
MVACIILLALKAALSFAADTAARDYDGRKCPFCGEHMRQQEGESHADFELRKAQLRHTMMYAKAVNAAKKYRKPVSAQGAFRWFRRRKGEVVERMAFTKEKESIEEYLGVVEKGGSGWGCFGGGKEHAKLVCEVLRAGNGQRRDTTMAQGTRRTARTQRM